MSQLEVCRTEDGGGSEAAHSVLGSCINSGEGGGNCFKLLAAATSGIGGHSRMTRSCPLAVPWRQARVRV